ncbi:MAG: Gfo/Idh/MocA family oxidoreductase [Archaeoglobi archaeon]|nr:Gfo/Idh/MocA family oxidoreductase [Archaeoglobi archaeon]
MIFGVIGVGSMGKNHVRVLTEIKRVEDVVIYDTNREQAERIAGMYDVRVAGSVEELLREVDAVNICSPTKFHFQHVRESIEAGKHTLVEKPLASSYDEGRKVLEFLSKRRDLVFGVGHIERFNPIVSELAGLELDVAYLSAKRHNPASSRITDSTVVEDLMIHDIDLVFNVIFSGHSDYEITAAGNRNVVQVLVKFGEKVASLSASRISSKKIRTIYLENEEMTVEGDFMTQELYIYRKPSVYQSVNEKYLQENVIEKVLINKVEPLKVELKAFVDAIDGKLEFPVTAEQAVNNLRICEMIRREIA